MKKFTFVDDQVQENLWTWFHVTCSHMRRLLQCCIHIPSVSIFLIASFYHCSFLYLWLMKKFTVVDDQVQENLWTWFHVTCSHMRRLLQCCIHIPSVSSYFLNCIFRPLLYGVCLGFFHPTSIFLEQLWKYYYKRKTKFIFPVMVLT